MSDLLIFHVTTVHSRFDVRILTKECAALQSAGFRRIVLVVADGKGNAEHGNIEIRDTGIAGPGRWKRILMGNWRMWRMIRKQRPAVVHFHDPELLFLGLVLKISGFQVIYDLHENVPLQIESKHYLPGILKIPVAVIVRSLEWFCYRIFDAFVAATPDIYHRFPAEKSVLVQNYPVIQEFSISKSMQTKSRSAAFAYVGGISRIRGALEMIEALRLCNPDKLTPRLEMAGKFDPPDLKSEIQKKPGWERVRWHGWMNRMQVSRLLSSVRAGLLLFHPVPNHIHAQPNKMFEYMAAGLPVIASDFTLWRKIIQESNCGLLVDPQDPEAVSRAMQWILDNPKQAQAMGRRGRQAIENSYNWDLESKKLIRLYSTFTAL